VGEKSFRSLKAAELLPDVYEGKVFVDGIMKNEKNGTGTDRRLMAVYTPVNKTSETIP